MGVLSRGVAPGTVVDNTGRGGSRQGPIGPLVEPTSLSGYIGLAEPEEYSWPPCSLRRSTALLTCSISWGRFARSEFDSIRCRAGARFAGHSCPRREIVRAGRMDHRSGGPERGYLSRGRQSHRAYRNRIVRRLRRAAWFFAAAGRIVCAVGSARSQEGTRIVSVLGRSFCSLRLPPIVRGNLYLLAPSCSRQIDVQFPPQCFRPFM
jgi:hypothetical protein